MSEIKWDQTPASTFPTREGEITYVEYYKKHHNIDIKDMQQPLLFSKPAPTGVRRRENRIIALIPELCQLTGIQDDLRANFNAMKVGNQYTVLNRLTLSRIERTTLIQLCHRCEILYVLCRQSPQRPS